MPFSLQSLSLETIVVLLLIAALSALSLRYGKSFLITYILALYPTYLIIIELPYAKTSAGPINFLIVLVVFLVTFFGIRNIIRSHFTYGVMRYVQSIVLSIIAAAITLIMYVGLAHAGVNISPFLLSTGEFLSNLIPIFAVWLALPIIALFFLGRE